MQELPRRKMRKSAELKFHVRLLWLHVKMHTPRLIRQTAPVLGAFVVIIFISTLALSWQKNIPVIREQNPMPQFLENTPATPVAPAAQPQTAPSIKKKFQDTPAVTPAEPAPPPIPESAQPTATLKQQAPSTPEEELIPEESEGEYGDEEYGGYGEAESEAGEESLPLEETAPTPPGASMMTAPSTSPQEKQAQDQMAQAQAKITAAENAEASAKTSSPQAAEALKLAKEKLAQAKEAYGQKDYSKATSLARESIKLAEQAAQ